MARRHEQASTRGSARRLTARSVEQAKPDPTKRIEVPDGLLPGFYLIVQPSGAKSWAVRFRQGGRPRKFTLGPVAALDLAQAREEAREALRKVAKARIRRPGGKRREPPPSRPIATCSSTSWPAATGF